MMQRVGPLSLLQICWQVVPLASVVRGPQKLQTIWNAE
jgi:hypothetical protein